MHNTKQPRCGLCSRLFNFMYRQKDEENLVYAVERLTKAVMFEAMVQDYPARHKVQLHNPYFAPINTPEELSLRSIYTYRDRLALAETKQLPQNQQQPHIHEEIIHNEEYAFIEKYARRWKARTQFNKNSISNKESEQLGETPMQSNYNKPLENRSSNESEFFYKHELDVDETVGVKISSKIKSTGKPRESFASDISSQVTVYLSAKSASNVALQSPTSFYSVLSEYPDASNHPIENVITSTALETDGTQSESSDSSNGAKENISRRP